MFSLKSLEEKYGKVKKSTVGFIIKDRKICLGMKKVKYGIGKWNGAGGKVGDLEEFKDETFENGMVREMKEEFDINVVEMDKVGEIVYLVDGVAGCEYSKVYFITKWDGEPSESNEMKPKWFEINEMPYDNMWDGDKIWLPELLSDRKIKAVFAFDSDESKILSYKMEDLNE